VHLCRKRATLLAGFSFVVLILFFLNVLVCFFVLSLLCAGRALLCELFFGCEQVSCSSHFELIFLISLWTCVFLVNLQAGVPNEKGLLEVDSLAFGAGEFSSSTLEPRTAGGELGALDWEESENSHGKERNVRD
jgi:hypothetical protein